MAAKKKAVRKKKTSGNIVDKVSRKGVGGRPTKYKPEYCQMLIDHMAEGLSYEAFAGLIGTTKQTLYNWEEHPEFLDAKRQGTEKCRMWWEKKGRDHLINEYQGPSINTGMWVFNMKNRFRDEWRDRQEIDHKVKGIEQVIEESLDEDS